MILKLTACCFLFICSISALGSEPLQEQPQKTVTTVSLCQILSHPDKYSESPITLRVRVNAYRHGVSISDRACPKQAITLIPDQSAAQEGSVSHFYQFLAKHRQSNIPIFATVTGHLAKGEDSGFLPRRNVVFKLESVSEISGGGPPKAT
jgi:hypothetical protein